MIEDKGFDLPPELSGSCEKHEINALMLVRDGNIEEAEAEYRELLKEIVAAQGKDVRFHKGGPYHQIGIVLVLREEYEEAFNYFLSAFVEDSISGETFPQAPAFQILNGLYNIKYQDLLDLHESIRERMKEDVPQDPEDYLKIYLSQGHEIQQIPLTKDRMVFIGGNYKNVVLLRYIEDKIKELELSPILALNFPIGEAKEQVYSHSMLLLRDCGYAVFEITFDAGHLMEIERAMMKKWIPEDRILLLAQRRLATDTEHYVSSMLLGTGLEIQPYTKIQELDSIISSFFEFKEESKST